MRTHGYSRRIITQLKREPEHILRNGVHVRMVDRVCAGDRITVILAEERLLRANPLLQVGIVYEDADLILFDKPPAMPVHPSFAHANDTLGNFFAFHTQSRGERISFRPINRLDADTTGLCLVAKNPLAASVLAQQVQKEYTAVLCGEPVQDSGEINLPIARDPSNPVRRCVSKEGQPSVTRYEVLNRKNGYTLVRVQLVTGRTHQIRVHFSHLGYPLAGDSMYGGDCSRIGRQALCCTRMAFVHPVDQRPMDFQIPIQRDMASLLEECPPGTEGTVSKETEEAM